MLAEGRFDAGKFSGEGLQFCGEGFQSFFILGFFLSRHNRLVFPVRRIEDGQHAVVIFLRNGIEFMIVTAGAADGHSQHRPAGGGENSVEFIHPGLLIIHVGFGTKAHVSSGDQAFDRAGFDFIACQLHLDEVVIGAVTIKACDDPIAIAPGVVAVAVELEAAGVGVADQVQPVAAPTLAVMAGSEKAVNDSFIGVGRWIVEKCGDFVRRRWNADDVQIDAA